MNESSHLRLDDSTQVGEARREAVRLSQALGFNETETGRVAIVTTEIAQNIIRHAGHGQIIVHPYFWRAGACLEILGIDHGPGILELARSLQDGFSTTGTAGTGLGAIRRLSSVFDIYSTSGGTVIMSRMCSSSPGGPAPASSMELGVICRPFPGETVSGDDWEYSEEGGRVRLLITDGLGHGPGASVASREIVRIFQSHIRRSLTEVTELCNAGIRHTRGAVMGIAEVDFEQHTVRFVGVGNIGGMIVAPGGGSGLASYGGTVGYSAPRIHEFLYAFPADAVLVLYSDGLQTRWDLDRYPGLAARHPSIIAGVLFRDFKRDNDDVTVLVLREGGPG